MVTALEVLIRGVLDGWSSSEDERAERRDLDQLQRIANNGNFRLASSPPGTLRFRVVPSGAERKWSRCNRQLRGTEIARRLARCLLRN